MSTKKLSIMICSDCNKDLDLKNFILNNISCYKCVYEKKKSLIKKKKIPSQYICKTCGNKFSHEDSLKCKQRYTYCSKDCAMIGQKEKIKNHWMRIGKRKNEVIIF